jgi:P27 family predicted phage terminase small subunit
VTVTASKAPANRRGKPNRALKPVPPAPPKGPSDRPTALGSAGGEWWDELMRLGSRFYAETDRAAILDYCKLRDLEAELESFVLAEGTTVTGSQGQEVMNPNMRLLMDVRKDIRAAGKDLALNPRDRVNLGLAVQTEVSKLDRLTQRRKASGN